MLLESIFFNNHCTNWGMDLDEQSWNFFLKLSSCYFSYLKSEAVNEILFQLNDILQLLLFIVTLSKTID